MFPIEQTNKQTDICQIELTAIFISNRIFTVITFLAGMKLSCREFWTTVKIHLKLPIQMLFAVIGWHSEGKERRKEFKPKMMKSGMDTVQREQQFVFKMWFTVSLLLQKSLHLLLGQALRKFNHPWLISKELFLQKGWPMSLSFQEDLAQEPWYLTQVKKFFLCCLPSYMYLA